MQYTQDAETTVHELIFRAAKQTRVLLALDKIPMLTMITEEICVIGCV